MLATLTLLALPVAAADEVRVALGGQIETAGHGIFDLAWRRGPLSVAWLTDTLDVRLSPPVPWGRSTLGVRSAAFAAGLWISPWQGGAPDPDRAQRAGYIGVDGEIQRNLGSGLYLTGSGWLQHHRFAPLEGSTLRLPPTQWGRLQTGVGLWRDDGAIQGRIALGLDATSPGRVAPHAIASVRWSPDLPIGPDLSTHLGIAEGQDDIVATRLGGATPYHVPFVGLAWAEAWVEDYGVARAGLTVRGDGWSAGPLVDVGIWTQPSLTTADLLPQGMQVGVGLRGEVHRGPWSANVTAGHAPTVDRPGGVWPVPIYLSLGYRSRSD